MRWYGLYTGQSSAFPNSIALFLLCRDDQIVRFMVVPVFSGYDRPALCVTECILLFQLTVESKVFCPESNIMLRCIVVLIQQDHAFVVDYL